MKKIIFGCLVLSFVFAACSKDNPSTAERLQHKWNFDREIFQETTSGVTTADTTLGSPGDYLQIASDGTFTFAIPSIGDITTGTYSLIDNDSRIVFVEGGDRDTINISTLTDNNLKLQANDDDGVTTSVTTFEFSR